MKQVSDQNFWDKLIGDALHKYGVRSAIRTALLGHAFDIAEVKDGDKLLNQMVSSFKGKPTVEDIRAFTKHAVEKSLPNDGADDPYYNPYDQYIDTDPEDRLRERINNNSNRRVVESWANERFDKTLDELDGEDLRKIADMLPNWEYDLDKNGEPDDQLYGSLDRLFELNQSPDTAVSNIVSAITQNDLGRKLD